MLLYRFVAELRLQKVDARRLARPWGVMLAIAVVRVRVNRSRLSHYDPKNVGMAGGEGEEVALVDLEDVVSPD